MYHSVEECLHARHRLLALLRVASYDQHEVLDELTQEHGPVVRCGDGATEDGVLFACYLLADGYELYVFTDGRPSELVSPDEAVENG
jgi:hypothetical protein